jgi:peptidyl-tRNA hydrolase
MIQTPKTKKMYVLVRTDIKRGQSSYYPAVQGGHALAAYLINFKNCEWKNEDLIYLNAKTEKNLKKWSLKLSCMGIPFSEFREPDLNNEITSIASYTDDYIFKSLNTL